jgi:hypothetical protein
MSKNPLSDIYANQVLLEEKDNVVVSAGQQEIAKGGKVGLAKGHGLEKVKDVEDPEEAEGTNILTGVPKKLNDSMEKPTRSFEGSFEKLFKATINEEMGEAPEIDMEVEIPTSNEDMVDELEGSKDEVSDLVSDLKAVMDHLQGILDKVSGESESEDSAEEAEFGDESSETEEEAVGEAVELKAVPDSAGKGLMGKSNKVGSLKPKGGKVNSGELEIEPDLKPAKAFDKSFQNTKSHAVKSTVQKGEFFK